MGKLGWLAVAAVLLAAPMAAEEWIDFSSPVQGKGGAGTALARGGTSQYYNPANASRRPWEGESLFHIEFDIPVAFSAAIHGESIRYIYDSVDLANDLQKRLDSRQFDPASTTLTLEDFGFAMRVLDRLDQLNNLNGHGAYVGTAAGFGVRMSGLLMPRDSFGLYLGGFGIGAVTPIADLESMRGFRLTDETGADYERLVATAIANSSTGTTPQTADGQNFSSRLQAGGFSQETADALAAEAERSGVDLNGAAASVLEDFLLNSLNGTGQSLESGANPFEGNRSGVLIRGMSWYEVALTYSFGLPILGNSDWLALGATVKFMQAYTYSELLVISEMDESGVRDSLRRFSEKARDAYQLDGDAERTNVGLDLGAVLTPQLPGLDTLAISFAARNVNGPEFRWDGSYGNEPKLVRFDPQFRLGASYVLFHGAGLPLSFAVEGDLNRVSSDILPKYHTQFLRAGVAWEPDFGVLGLGFRAGALQNIGDADQATTATAGLGVRIGFLKLDVGGQISLERRKFGKSDDYQLIPQRFGASAQIGIDLKW